MREPQNAEQAIVQSRFFYKSSYMYQLILMIQTAYDAYYLEGSNYLRNRNHSFAENIGICRTTCGEIGCLNSAIVEIRFNTQLRGKVKTN